MSLSTFLESAGLGDDFQSLRGSVFPNLFDAILQIGDQVKTSRHLSQAKAVDNHNSGILDNLIQKCPAVKTAITADAKSSQTANEHAGGEEYTITFDPPDGSPNISPNWTVGVIIGIWAGRTVLHQEPRQRLIVSILGIFGPRTTAVIGLNLPDSKACCFEVEIGPSGLDGSKILRPEIRLSLPPFKTKFFAPANLAAAIDDQRYTDLITHFIKNKYTLRYNGGLAPDVAFALDKGHGIYISPVSKLSKPKMWKALELFPVALIMECAGGKAIDPGNGDDIMSRAVEDLHEKAGIICGSTEDVDVAMKLLNA